MSCTSLSMPSATSAARPRRVAVDGTHPLIAFFGLLALWCRRSAQRKALRDLARADRIEGHGRLLRDVGLSPARVRDEGRKWFWRA
jgi:uncharacterized protein YjiS (DUF1127 family)